MDLYEIAGLQSWAAVHSDYALTKMMIISYWPCGIGALSLEMWLRVWCGIGHVSVVYQLMAVDLGQGDELPICIYTSSLGDRNCTIYCNYCLPAANGYQPFCLFFFWLASDCVVPLQCLWHESVTLISTCLIIIIITTWSTGLCTGKLCEVLWVGWTLVIQRDLKVML